MADTFTLPVRRYDVHTRRTRLLTLEAGAAPFTFHCGQAVWLGQTGQGERKPYSIASAPADLEHRGVLEFLVGLDDTGEPGSHLAGIGPGSLIDVHGPLGGFDLPLSVPDAPVMLVGGGTGIAPLRSMWRELLAQPAAANVSVIYSARASSDLAFIAELEGLEREGAIRLAITVTGTDVEWAGGRGRLTDAALVEHVTRPSDTRCAICGPDLFVAHVVEILTRVGVPPEHVATERW